MRTIDMHDDLGQAYLADLAGAEPSEFFKTASWRESSELLDRDFALILVDEEGHEHRKFASFDTGNTWMSVYYLLNTEHGLPDFAVKVAAANLLKSASAQQLQIPLDAYGALCLLEGLDLEKTAEFLIDERRVLIKEALMGELAHGIGTALGKVPKLIQAGRGMASSAAEGAVGRAGSAYAGVANRVKGAVNTASTAAKETGNQLSNMASYGQHLKGQAMGKLQGLQQAGATAVGDARAAFSSGIAQKPFVSGAAQRAESAAAAGAQKAEAAAAAAQQAQQARVAAMQQQGAARRAAGGYAQAPVAAVPPKVAPAPQVAAPTATLSPQELATTSRFPAGGGNRAQAMPPTRTAPVATPTAAQPVAAPAAATAPVNRTPVVGSGANDASSGMHTRPYPRGPGGSRVPPESRLPPEAPRAQGAQVPMSTAAQVGLGGAALGGGALLAGRKHGAASEFPMAPPTTPSASSLKMPSPGAAVTAQPMTRLASFDIIKEAQQKWADFTPYERRDLALNLVKIGSDESAQIPWEIEQYSGEVLNPRFQNIMWMRQGFTSDEKLASDYDRLGKVASVLNLEETIEALYMLDEQAGLLGRYGQWLPDPVLAVCAVEKNAEYSWINGGKYVNERQLILFSQNPDLHKRMKALFYSDMVDTFRKDPIGTFKKLPEEQKRIIVNLATQGSGSNDGGFSIGGMSTV
jgi:hypothetical protein